MARIRSRHHPSNLPPRFLFPNRFVTAVLFFSSLATRPPNPQVVAYTGLASPNWFRLVLIAQSFRYITLHFASHA